MPAAAPSRPPEANSKRNGKALNGIISKGLLAERGADLYETPAAAVHALIAAEAIPAVVWEPAAGRGAIARVLRAAGHTVVATDLVAYDGADPEITGGVDFLAQQAAPHGVQCIVTNPPYQRSAERFAAHALELVPRVYLLLRFGVLSAARAASKVLDGGTLARVLTFIERLEMMHRDGYRPAAQGQRCRFRLVLLGSRPHRAAGHHPDQLPVQRLWRRPGGLRL